MLSSHCFASVTKPQFCVLSGENGWGQTSTCRLVSYKYMTSGLKQLMVAALHSFPFYLEILSPIIRDGFFLFSLQISNTSSHFSFFSQWSCLFSEKRKSQERNDTFIHHQILLPSSLPVYTLPSLLSKGDETCLWLAEAPAELCPGVCPTSFLMGSAPSVLRGSHPSVNRSISIGTCCRTALTL